ncbi:hypothetical protein PanWU01x14_207820, partial [Parasponia andersonii]
FRLLAIVPQQADDTHLQSCHTWAHILNSNTKIWTRNRKRKEEPYLLFSLSPSLTLIGKFDLREELQKLEFQKCYPNIKMLKLGVKLCSDSETYKAIATHSHSC